MTTTTNLNITELEQSQVNAYLTVNEAIQVLERASCGRTTIDFPSDADLTLEVDTSAGAEQWRDKFITFTDVAVPLTAGRDVIFPAKEGPEYIITNSTGFTLTLKISGQTGVTIADAVTGRYYYNGTDIVAAP